MTERDKAFEIVQNLLKAPTPTLLAVREQLITEGKSKLVEIVDAVLSLRPDP